MWSCWFCSYLKVKVTRSCPTLCNPPGLYGPWNSPGQSTGVGSLSLLQEIFPTQGLSQVSCIAGGFFTSWATKEAPNTGVGSLSLLQRIFPTQELNRGLLHCRWILYQQLSGKPKDKHYGAKERKTQRQGTSGSHQLAFRLSEVHSLRCAGHWSRHWCCTSE